jgi:hypothetical protein
VHLSNSNLSFNEHELWLRFLDFLQDGQNGDSKALQYITQLHTKTVEVALRSELSARLFTLLHAPGCDLHSRVRENLPPPPPCIL